MVESTKIKICGITNLEDARYASGAMVDFLGFIFTPKSKRYVDPAEAGAMVGWLEGPEKVGVFLDQPLDEVNQIAKEAGVDLVQLHGNESVEYCQLIEKPIIKVIHVEAETTREQLQSKVDEYDEVAQYFLFDAKVGGEWGGTGHTFDWNLLKDVAGEKPFFLAGGITPENAAEAIKTVKPFALDVNSGVEEKPGLKDFEKIEQLMQNVNSIEPI